MLAIQEFIKLNKINIDILFINKFWYNIKENKSILIDDQIIRWLTGNQNAKIYTSRNTIKDKIKKINSYMKN